MVKMSVLFWRLRNKRIRHIYDGRDGDMEYSE